MCPHSDSRGPSLTPGRGRARKGAPGQMERPRGEARGCGGGSSAPWVRLLAVRGDLEPAPPLLDRVLLAGETGKNPRVSQRLWLYTRRALQSRRGPLAGRGRQTKRGGRRGRLRGRRSLGAPRRVLLASPTPTPARSGDRALGGRPGSGTRAAATIATTSAQCCPSLLLAGLGRDGASLSCYPLSLSILLILQKFGFTATVLPFCRKESAAARSGHPRKQGSPGCCRHHPAAGPGDTRLCTRRPPEGARAPSLRPPDPGPATPCQARYTVLGQGAPGVCEGQPRACWRRRSGLV